MTDATVTAARFDPGRSVVEYRFETGDGRTGTATLSRRPWGPGTELTDDAMRQLADELPGTPVYDETDGHVFDAETVPSVGVDE